MPPTVYPIGTTIYRPNRCYNGYTLISFEVGPQTSRLIDMNGNIINEWKANVERAKLLRTGDIIVVGRGKPRTIQEYDWEHRLVWEYNPPGGCAHHDVQRLENGNTVLICREIVPEEYMKKIKNPKRRNLSIYSDMILEVTPNKDIIWEWHEYEHFDINWYCPICDSDWTHTNTVQVLPENRWYDEGDVRFKPGNVLISPRSLDTILIIDRKSKQIVWKYTGNYRGGLSGQHEPHMIRKGLPGAGNILIFDNGASPQNNLKHAGESYVLEINPLTKKIVWKYENGEKFFSKFRGTIQRVSNGNTLICEADGCRVFEVTLEGEIVWEYAIPYPYRIGRAYRYPYDYTPQLKILKKPEEIPLIPPKYALTRVVNVPNRDFQIKNINGNS